MCLLNPVFKASRLVVGADADLVVDDMLIEVKTTGESRVSREQFNQLLGYYILYLLGGVEGAPANHSIKRLGLYQSRQARLMTWHVSEIASTESFLSAAAHFERIARGAFGWSPLEDWRAVGN
jgi:hypothetical protein